MASALPDRPEQLLAQRRTRLAQLLQRDLEAPVRTDMAAEKRTFLREEAEELYWNELSWEKLTEDEAVERGGLVELAFPGFLAFVEGLLLREVMPDALAPAAPRPEVVEDVLLFLSERVLELDRGEGEDDDPEHAAIELAMTMRLIDLVLYRLHDLPVEEVERLELSHADDD
jgi:hypothetical protein